MGALVSGRRVLDLGIGPGVSAIEMAAAAPRAEFVGLDVSAAMLRRARRRADAAGLPLPLVRADARLLPFAEESFDGAAGHSFLYLVPDPAAVLAEVRRALRRGGRVALLEPRAGRAPLAPVFREGPRPGISMALWRFMSRLHRRFGDEELAALLERAGFSEARAWPVMGGLGVVATAVRA